MASDLSSVGDIDDIEIFDEKEEGEISLEDVSSSEESHPRYRTRFPVDRRCTICMHVSTCASWCVAHKEMQRQHSKQGKEIIIFAL